MIRGLAVGRLGRGGGCGNAAGCCGGLGLTISIALVGRLGGMAGDDLRRAEKINDNSKMVSADDSGEWMVERGARSEEGWKNSRKGQKTSALGEAVLRGLLQ